MKKTFFSFLFIAIVSIGFGQNVPTVQSNAKGLYLTHTVQPKENFYSIGRQYNAPPKEIAAFNALDMAAGLSVGQTVQIPLTAANFSQTKTSSAPVYYVVGEKEGLYRVSTKNGKVLMADLRKWNKLASDNLSAGQKLIVGFLQSGEGSQTAAVVKSEAEPPPTETAPQPRKEETQTPAPQKAPATTAEKTTAAAPKQTAASGAGYFKNQFDLQSRDHKASYDATITSGVFKTTSGWQDAKYYALMDKVEPGTIVQVLNPANNRSIYAKVLGEMSGIRQNQGLELRISNAAATALDIAEPDKFMVRVLY